MYNYISDIYFLFIAIYNSITHLANRSSSLNHHAYTARVEEFGFIVLTIIPTIRP